MLERVGPCYRIPLTPVPVFRFGSSNLRSMIEPHTQGRLPEQVFLADDTIADVS